MRLQSGAWCSGRHQPPESVPAARQWRNQKATGKQALRHRARSACSPVLDGPLIVCGKCGLMRGRHGRERLPGSCRQVLPPDGPARKNVVDFTVIGHDRAIDDHIVDTGRRG